MMYEHWPTIAGWNVFLFSYFLSLFLCVCVKQKFQTEKIQCKRRGLDWKETNYPIHFQICKKLWKINFNRNTQERERERETNPFEREMLHKSFERRETKCANGSIENFFFFIFCFFSQLQNGAIRMLIAAESGVRLNIWSYFYLFIFFLAIEHNGSSREQRREPHGRCLLPSRNFIRS